jgi:hypothetical protein
VPIGAILLLMACISLFFFGALDQLLGNSDGPDIPLPVLLLMEVPFFVIGVGMIAWGLMPLVARARVAPPTITISTDTLRVGQRFVVTYQQQFARAAEVQRAGGALILRETATYRRGTNTYTVTHEHTVSTFDLPARRYEAGEVASARQEFEVPRGAMHSFTASRNKLAWLLRVSVALPGWPDVNEEYPLTVLADWVR